MSLHLLQPIAERAAAESIDGKLVLLTIERDGIAVSGKLFYSGVYDGDPPRTYAAMHLSTWREITTDGILPLERAIAIVVETLDRRAVQVRG